ncbi:MAG: hypothetical protein DDT22_00957 [candidate division WS2 bacterium]|nr:hypothetical protein [Candidatus Lithacetigena glycinireducens]
MKNIDALTEGEISEILEAGFDTTFWKIIEKILVSWRADKAHKIGAGVSLSPDEIRIEQGSYRTLTDVINLKETQIKRKKKKEVKM